MRISRLIEVLPLLLLSCCLAAAQTAAHSPAVVQPAVTSADSPEITQFQKIEDTWADAVNQRDQYALELVLSPLFVDVSASGDVSTRNQQLALMITGDDKILHLEQKVITVRMLGDVAVANGTYVLHRKAGSTPVDEKGVFTHVYERARGGWMCINSQRTRIPEDTSAKTKKQPGPETPFHIPLFGKGEK